MAIRSTDLSDFAINGLEETTSKSNSHIGSAENKQLPPTLEPKELQKREADAELSTQELEKIRDSNKEYKPFDIADPVDMMYIFMPNFRNGFLSIYPWQAETLQLWSLGIFNKQTPLKYILCACNGSGKDSFCIAPFAVWHCITKIRSRVIITSSSVNQLKNQTAPGIESIVNAINQYQGEKVLVVKHWPVLHVVCRATGSEILCFATDDPGLAEGYHPFPDYPNAEMCLIINECKTVEDEMFKAIRRCNGYNRWIEVSSPGEMSGHFYNMWQRSTPYPDKYVLGSWYSRRVTYKDCPHLSIQEVEDDKLTYGESSPIFRSMYLAEFTDMSEATIMPPESISKLITKNQKGLISDITKPGLSVGGDLSYGGDETSLYLLKGNIILEEEHFHLFDTVQLFERLKLIFTSWHTRYGLQYEDIRLDDGNLGRSIIHMLHDAGFDVRAIVNQSRASNKKQFANLGAELWFNVRRLVEEGILKLDAQKDAKLIEQLRSRKFKQHTVAGTIVLESKKDSKAAGRGSPDRADAYVLALSKWTIEDFLESSNRSNKSSDSGNLQSTTRFQTTDTSHKFTVSEAELLSLQQLKDRFEENEFSRKITYKTRETDEDARSVSSRIHFNSLSSLLKQKKDPTIYG